MKSDKSLKEQILETENNHVFFRTDFPEYHQESVGRVLSELVDEGVLIRLSPGIYIKPMISLFGLVMPSVEKVVKAIAERDKVQVLPSGVVALNALGLSTQVPMAYNYLTMGSARILQVGDKKVTLKRGVPRNFAYKTQLIAWLVQALRTLGEENIGEAELAQIRRLVKDEPNREAVRNDVLMMQGWMKRILKPMID